MPATVLAVASPIYPNPTQDGAQFVLTLQQAQHVQVSVIDLQGRIISTQSLNVNGQTTVSVPTANLATGLYQVVTTIGNSVQTQRLAVVR